MFAVEEKDPVKEALAGAGQAQATAQASSSQILAAGYQALAQGSAAATNPKLAADVHAHYAD